ncbi:hypothetical protein [Stenotrophomonas acidaminiphila]|uniref:hypothetical protein n=1 Tax=Stenotrophomonas acidaminiphila TaxID=128780 RepID=UPI0028B25A02|nr:hypothetical protein [Stenotrophomonas acidaminiphila]
MAGRFGDYLGTLFSKFQLGLGGPQLKGAAGAIEARNDQDNAYAAVRAALFATFGNDFELNAGAAEAADDWKFTFRRPSTGMTHNLVVVMPAGDPAPGQALTVASFADDVIALQWTTIAAGNDKLVIDTTSIAFGASSPVAMFTLPASAIVERVQVIVDEPFNGAPSLSVGVAGATSKYLGSTQVDLRAGAGTVFEVTPGLEAVGTTEALIASYAAGGASQGEARVLVTYAIPG